MSHCSLLLYLKCCECLQIINWVISAFLSSCAIFTIHWYQSAWLYLITPPPERGNRIDGVCLCVFVCVFVCQQDYAKSNWRISLKFCRLIRNDSGTNPLTFGNNLDLILDLRSRWNFQTRISQKITSGFLRNFVGWTGMTTGRTSKIFGRIQIIFWIWD